MSASPVLPKEILSLAHAVIVARSPSPLFSQFLQSYTNFLNPEEEHPGGDAFCEYICKL
jgi:hypothetical protein